MTKWTTMLNGHQNSWKMNYRLILSILIVIGVWGCKPNDMDNNNPAVCNTVEGQGVKETTESEDICSLDRDSSALSETVQSVDTIPDGYKSVYDSLVKMNKDNGILSYYFLYDITKDGIPEIWIKTGTCEADYGLNVYTIANGDVRQILDSDGGHIDFFLKGDTIGSIICNTGCGFVSIYRYNGKKITKQSAEFSMWNEEGKAIAVRKDEQEIVDIWEERDTSLKFKFLN